MASLTAQNPDFEAAVRSSFTRISLMHTLGAQLERVAPGEVHVAPPFREKHSQHHGHMVTAALTAIADVGCGYAAMTLMPAGASVLTVEYKANLRGARPGRAGGRQRESREAWLHGHRLRR
jgi:acyl-coenzyme A thioesterase PaaI-like protein